MSNLPNTPAPWKLTSRAWTFLVSGLSSTSSFPAGFADPHEAETLASGGEFIGTPGLIMIVSYSESPVGPYDELVYIPGRWKYEDGSSGYRISRIYVSSKASVVNGRRNWNIPKSVADFSITTASNGESTIKVSHPGASEPFFHVTTKRVPLLSHIPIPFVTRLLGKYFCLIQPPLPAREHPEEIATTQWATVFPSFSGTAHLERIIPQVDRKVGDGKEIPAVLPWSVGLYSSKLAMDFPEAVFKDSM